MTAFMVPGTPIRQRRRSKLMVTVAAANVFASASASGRLYRSTPEQAEYILIIGKTFFAVPGALVSVPQFSGDRKKRCGARSGYFHAFSRRGVVCANSFQIIIKFSNISNFKF